MRVQRFISGTIAAALVLTMAASQANASRRSSLHGDQLLEDVTDVFLMPQLLGQYRNLMRAEYGSGGTSGDGLLIFGTDTMAFGLAAHRGDNTNPLNGVRLPAAAHSSILNGASGFQGLGLAAPSTVVDLMMSLAMGEDAALGFRLGFANSGNSTTPDGGDTSGVSQTSLLLEIGYSLMGDLRMDNSLFLAVGLGSDTANQGTPDDAWGGTDLAVSVNNRTYLPMMEQVELGILANLGIRTASAGVDGQASSSQFDWNFAAGAGPVYKLDKARIAAYGYLGLSGGSHDPNSDVDDDETSSFSLVIPGVHMAMEVDITDWFQFRTGIEYRWIMNSNSDAADNSASQTGGDFGMSLGFGLKTGDFSMDFALDNSWLTTGPDFLGGDPGAMFGSVSAGYKF